MNNQTEIICEIRYKNENESTVTLRRDGEEPIHVSNHNSIYYAIWELANKLDEALNQNDIHDRDFEWMDSFLNEYSYTAKQGGF